MTSFDDISSPKSTKENKNVIRIKNVDIIMDKKIKWKY